VDIKDGDMKWRKRVRPRARKVYSSMTAVGGRLYVPSRTGTTYVFEAAPEFNLLAANQLEPDTEAEQSAFNATPVPLGDRLLMRSDSALYCIEK
jgi:outer membrane protein assembly factor BamB